MNGSIRNLPAEILGEIFDRFVKGAGSPRTLVRVCKGWEQTALMTPQLWSHIRLASGPQNATHCLIVNGESRYFLFDQQLCFTEAHLHSALARSGMVPLTVAIDYLWWPVPILGALQNPYILFSQPLCQRIKDLSIIHTLFPTLPDRDLMDNCRFPLLKNLKVYSGTNLWGSTILESVSRTAHHLDELDCSIHFTPQDIHHSFWTSLKRLLVCNKRPLEGLNLIAPRLENIEDLDFIGSEWPDSQSPHITWHKLRVARLKCEYHLLQRLHLPKLESLNLEETCHITGKSGREGRIHFPSLTNLIVVTDDPGWITEMEAPELRDLSITSRDWSGSYLGQRGGVVCDLSPMLKIETLVLNVWWDDVALLNLLMTVPAVRHLTVRRQHRNPDHGLLMLDRLASSFNGLVPYLETLRLGDPAWPVYTKKIPAVSSLRQLVATRKRLGRPLKEVGVYWDSRIDNYA